MINTLVVLVKMLAAHLLGDFFFQTDKMCGKKISSIPSDKFTSLSLHAFIQAILTYVFLAQWSNWIVPVVIAMSHFFIDWIKSNVKNCGLRAFLFDQFAHYLVIIGLWWIYYTEFNHPIGASSYIFSFNLWVKFTAFIAVLFPASILIKLFLEFEKWTPDAEVYRGLPNAGKWIGYFERVLILIFIFTSNIEGVGFLLAAKSIFRFGELNRTKDLKVTEYVLIGTFASFTLAIIIAYAAIWFINLICE